MERGGACGAGRQKGKPGARRDGRFAPKALAGAACPTPHPILALTSATAPRRADLNPLPTQRRRSLRQAFCECDASGDGKITKNEFFRSLDRAGFHMTFEEKLEQYSKADVDEDGAMEWPE